MRETRTEAQHPHPPRQSRVEQAVVPVGGLEQFIGFIEGGHIEVEIVLDAVLGKFQMALSWMIYLVFKCLVESVYGF